MLPVRRLPARGGAEPRLLLLRRRRSARHRQVVGTRLAGRLRRPPPPQAVNGIVVGRALLLGLLAGCSHPAPPATAALPVAARVMIAPALSRSAAIHGTAGSDRLIDATFDQEARGGRPTWSAPPAVSGGIRITLDALAPEARLCFAGALEPAIDVTFTLTPGGRASDVLVESAHASRRDCLVRALERAVFPVCRRPWRVAHAFRL